MAMKQRGRFYASANGEIWCTVLGVCIARVSVESLILPDAVDVSDTILAALDAKYPALVDEKKG